MMSFLKTNYRNLITCFFVVIFYTLHFSCSDMFVYKSLFFYYSLVITTCIVLIYIAVRLLQHGNKPVKFSINILTIIPFVFLFFPLIFRLTTANVEWYASVSFICGFALIFLLSFSFSNNYIHIITVENTIILFAFAESLICVLQTLGVYGQSQFFSTTGSNANPNITAMFLVMAFPLIIKRLSAVSKFRIYLSGFVLMIVLAAIVVLKSRTAYIGLMLVIVLLSVYYLKNKRKKLLIPVISVCVLMAVFAFVKLYSFKEHSADGRLFVWKVALEMIKEKPLGYGFGMVQSEYNRSQAQFFLEKPTSKTEKQHATYMTNVMNDYLEMLVQGGVFSCVLYVLFLFSLIYYSCKSLKNNLFYVTGISAFAAMGLFNFALYAPFAAMVFAYYTSIINADSSESKDITFSKPVLVVFLVLSIVPLAFFCLQISSQIQLKQIDNRIKTRNYDGLQNDFAKSKLCVSTSEIYYRTGGDIALLQKDYKTAINFYSTAIKYAPFPTLVTRKAYSEAMLDRDNQAISDLKLATNIQPSLFEPLYSLMMMYVKLKDLENARETANLIINKEIKVPSEKIVYYKEQARIVIRSMK